MEQGCLNLVLLREILPEVFVCPLKLFYHKRETNRTFITMVSYVVLQPEATYSKIKKKK